MLRYVFLAFALAALLAPAQANAWGAAHVGYTHVGPGGVYHAGGTAIGGYGGQRYGYGGYHYGYGGYHNGYTGYRYGYGAYGYHPYHYAVPTYGGYGGYRGVYRAGVYRAW